MQWRFEVCSVEVGLLKEGRECVCEPEPESVCWLLCCGHVGLLPFDLSLFSQSSKAQVTGHYSKSPINTLPNIGLCHLVGFPYASNKPAPSYPVRFL